MITEAQKRKQLVKKINRIPSNKLKELEDYISMLEQKINNKAKLLSFAGAWGNIEDTLLLELTEKLIDRRQSNKRRISDD